MILNDTTTMNAKLDRIVAHAKQMDCPSTFSECPLCPICPVDDGATTAALQKGAEAENELADLKIKITRLKEDYENGGGYSDNFVRDIGDL